MTQSYKTSDELTRIDFAGIINYWQDNDGSVLGSALRMRGEIDASQIPVKATSFGLFFDQIEPGFLKDYAEIDPITGYNIEDE